MASLFLQKEIKNIIKLSFIITLICLLGWLGEALADGAGKH